MAAAAKSPAAPALGPAPPMLLRLPDAWALTDDAFSELLQLNQGWRFEIDDEGRLRVMSGAGFASSGRAWELGGQLRNWARAGGGGHGTAADGFYRIGPRLLRAPDVAWVSDERAEQIEDSESIPRICPDFVIEVRSPSDRPADQQRKLETWIEHGVRLGWLIDPFAETVHIYRPGQPPEVRRRPPSLSGEDVLAGLAVDLANVWRPRAGA